MARRGLDRRTFLRGAAALAATISASGLLSACDMKPANEDSITTGEDGGAPVDPEALPSSTLVVYYSATGNTKAVGDAIAEHLDADVFELTPKEPYTQTDLDYNDDDSRVSREYVEYVRTVELVKTTPDGFEGYDTVFLGYPIWWGENSWVVNNFAIENDFEGKTVIPFCTSASSPIGTSAEDLAAMAGAGEWQEGKRFASDAPAEEVTAWVDGLGLQTGAAE